MTPSLDHDDRASTSDFEQNDNWAWSPVFTEFIGQHLEGFSLKVCTGLRPIADVNLDLKPFPEIADSPNADFTHTPLDTSASADGDDRLNEVYETLKPDAPRDVITGRLQPSIDPDRDTDICIDPSLYEGYACHGDAYALPFQDNTFDSVVSDPEWLDVPQSDHHALFDELVRVTNPTGVIIYNATWFPENDHTRRFQERFRQQRDFWGNSSFAVFYRRESRTIQELFDAFEYDSLERYHAEAPFWPEAYPPDAASTTHNTDPKKISPDHRYQHYCCPMCGCAHLGHHRSEFFETTRGEYTTYECQNCRFRVDADTVDRLADALANALAATDDTTQLTDLETIDYTPPCIKHELDRLAPDDPLASARFDPSLPWTPTPDDPGYPRG